MTSSGQPAPHQVGSSARPSPPPSALRDVPYTAVLARVNVELLLRLQSRSRRRIWVRHDPIIVFARSVHTLPHTTVGTRPHTYRPCLDLARTRRVDIGHDVTAVCRDGTALFARKSGTLPDVDPHSRILEEPYHSTRKLPPDPGTPGDVLAHLAQSPPLPLSYPSDSSRPLHTSAPLHLCILSNTFSILSQRPRRNTQTSSNQPISPQTSHMGFIPSLRCNRKSRSLTGRSSLR